MTFTAEAETTIAGPIDAVFEAFIDYRAWAQWMPPTIVPVRGPDRALHQGDRLFVRIANALPSVLTVDRLDAPREVRWSGGIPGLVMARHSFLFEAAAEGSTRIRSVEPWTGLLTAPRSLARGLLRAAERGGRAQLAGFARWFSQESARRAA
jgi:hypothetical protein